MKMRLLAVIAFLGVPAFAGAGTWTATETALDFKTTDGRVVKHLVFEHKQTTTAFVSITGGTCGNGGSAWLDSRHSTPGSAAHSFQFFGRDGTLLWEKPNVVGSSVADDCRVLVLMEADPKWLAKNQHGNTPHKPNIYNAKGALLIGLPECSTYAYKAQVQGRYGSILCSGDAESPFVILFDSISGNTKKIPGSVGVDWKDDGSYGLFTQKQSFDPKTKQYGDYVRTDVGSGKLK